MFHLGPNELIIIFAIVVILFGVGRIGKIGQELGGAIRSFRENMRGEEQVDKKP